MTEVSYPSPVISIDWLIDWSIDYRYQLASEDSNCGDSTSVSKVNKTNTVAQESSSEGGNGKILDGRGGKDWKKRIKQRRKKKGRQKTSERQGGYALQIPGIVLYIAAEYY